MRGLAQVTCQRRARPPQRVWGYVETKSLLHPHGPSRPVRQARFPLANEYKPKPIVALKLFQERLCLPGQRHNVILFDSSAVRSRILPSRAWNGPNIIAKLIPFCSANLVTSRPGQQHEPSRTVMRA